MTNTIDLLEIIGRDASLRHASGEHLSQALNGLHASEALKQAAISGDDSHLAKELGHRDIKTPNHPNNNVGGGHDHDDDQDDSHHEDDDGDDEGGDDPGKSDK